jgi:hypothetical protein
MRLMRNGVEIVHEMLSIREGNVEKSGVTSLVLKQCCVREITQHHNDSKRVQ